MAALKKYWWVSIAVIILVIILHQRHRINKLSDQIQLSNIELSTLKDSVNVYISKDSTLTFKINSIEIERDNLKKSLELSGFEIKDLRSRDIKWRNINLALEAKLKAAGSGTIILHDSIPIPGDTVKVAAKVGRWNDGFLYLTPFLVKNKLDFTYRYELGFRFIGEKQGKNTVVSAYLVSATNPGIKPKNIKIVTGNSFVVVPDKKSWWNHWYFYTAIGAFGGIYIAEKLK